MRFAFAILESSPASRVTSSGGCILGSAVRLVRKLLTSCAVTFLNAGSAKSDIAKQGKSIAPCSKARNRGWQVEVPAAYTHLTGSVAILLTSLQRSSGEAEYQSRPPSHERPE